jgi:nucleotidyltransferase substrate binding protein (TIGR01987 family)
LSTNPQRLENLSLAVASLREYVEEPIATKRDLAGIVFGFVLAFELAWKCLQDRIVELGYAERGPKLTLSASLQAGLIPVAEENTWAQMLEDRNLATHIYNVAFAEELVARIEQTHLSSLERLVVRLGSQGTEAT